MCVCLYRSTPTGICVDYIEAPLWFYCVFWLRTGKLSWQYWTIDLFVRELVAFNLYISPNDLTLCARSVYSTVAIFPNHTLRSNFVVDSEHQVFKSFGSKKWFIIHLDESYWTAHVNKYCMAIFITTYKVSDIQKKTPRAQTKRLNNKTEYKCNEILETQE